MPYDTPPAAPVQTPVDTPTLESLQELLAERNSRVAELEESNYQAHRDYYLLKQDYKALEETADHLRQERDDLAGQLSEERFAGHWLCREHDKCGKLVEMLKRQVARLEDALLGKQRGGDPQKIGVDVDEHAELCRRAQEAVRLRDSQHYLQAVTTDPRLKNGYRDINAALVDLVGAPTLDGTFTEPKRVYRAALAERTGLSLSSITEKLPHLEAMGTIKVDRRQVAQDETELWISLGPLPDKSLSAQDIKDLCKKADQERGRKPRCPSCGSQKLAVKLLACKACGATCTPDEATAAGSTMRQAAGGQIVDEHGVIVHPGRPELPFQPAETPPPIPRGGSNGHRKHTETPPPENRPRITVRTTSHQKLEGGGEAVLAPPDTPSNQAWLDAHPLWR